MVNHIGVKVITAQNVTTQEAHEGAGREISNGQWVEETEMAGELHGLIGGNLYMLLAQHVKAYKLGRVYPDNVNFVLNGTPDHIIDMRIPDVAFVAKDRLNEVVDSYLYLAPDLAVEIISPSERERPSVTKDKLDDYLRFGTKQVWVVDSETQTVVIHYPDRSTKTLHKDELLTGDDLIPGFSVQVSTLFELD